MTFRLTLNNYKTLDLESAINYILTDGKFVRELIRTIDSTIDAKDRTLHVQAVQILLERCTTLKRSLKGHTYIGERSLQAAFERIEDYHSDKLIMQMH